ncbi:MAG: DUF6146 family protein [Lentimicrobium sp.]
MKSLITFIFILISVCACTTQKKAVKSPDTIPVVVVDSTEYEITIIDPDFDHWYLMYFSQVQDRSNEYYRAMNGLGVSNWNIYYARGRYSDVIGCYINFIPSVDYGMEVNRKLYWYFKYIEETFRIRLLR